MERLGGKSDITDPRFIVTHNGETDFKMIPRSSDGQMLSEDNLDYFGEPVDRKSVV